MDTDKDLPHVKCTTEISVQTDDDDIAEQIISMELSESFLVKLESGKVKRVDDNIDDSSFTVADFGKHVKMCYNQQFGSVIALDSNLVCARRESNEFFQMSTMLEQPTGPNGTMRIELGVGEDAVWKCFLATQDLQKYPELRRFKENLEGGDQGKCKLGFNTSTKVDVKTLFTELNAAIAEDREKQQPNGFFTFYYANYLLERLRLILFPTNPYSTEKQHFPPSQQIGAANELMRLHTVSKNLMNVEAARRLSFWKWPHPDFKNAIPAHMAEAGFYHQPNEGGDDRVLCFACNVCLVSWEPEDDPQQEHERHSTACKFLTAPMASSNIPLSATMSNLAPINWNREENPNNCTNTQIDSLILGSMTANSVWFAFGCSDSKASITLLHLDKIVQTPYNFSIDIGDQFLINAFGLSTGVQQQNAQIGPMHNSTTFRRVTWSDTLPNGPDHLKSFAADDHEHNHPQQQTMVEERSKKNNNNESAHSQHKQQTPPQKSIFSSSYPPGEIVKVTAICCAGIGPHNEQAKMMGSAHPAAIGKTTGSNVEENSSGGNVLGVTNVTSTLFLGIALDESKIQMKNGNEEVIALNTMNVVATENINSPRISLAENADNERGKKQAASSSLHPFVLVYHITESEMDQGAQAKLADDSGSTESRMFEQCAIETDRLLAETKKLQEQTAALESELVEFLKVDQPEKKEEEEPIVEDLVNFDDNMGMNNNVDDGGGGGGMPQLPVCIGNGNSLQYSSLNQVNILYDPMQLSSIVMQCFRLPEELDSTSYRIDLIVATEQNDGYAVFGINHIDGRQSAIVVYSRIEVVNMLQESYQRKFHLSQGNLAQILLLTTDHFAAYRAKKEAGKKLNKMEEEIGGGNNQIPGRSMFSAVLRFTTGQVILFDLNSALWVPIYEAREGGGELPTDVTFCQNGGEGGLGQIVVLTKHGRLLYFDVRQPVRQHSDNHHEEKLLFEITKALESDGKSAGSEGEQWAASSSSSPSCFSGILPDNALSSLDGLAQLWALTHPVLPTSPPNMPTDASRLNDVKSTSNGVQVHVPMGWADKHLQQQRKKQRANSSTSALHAKEEFQKLEAASKCAHNSWSFSRIAGPGLLGGGNREHNLVFEMSLMPILPLTHVEITLEFPMAVNPLWSFGQLSIWLMDTEEVDQLMRRNGPATHQHHSMGGFSNVHSKQSLLSLLTDRPELLNEKGKCVYGPVPIAPSISGSSALLQISASPFIMATAGQAAGKQRKSWLNQNHRFFVLFQSLMAGPSVVVAVPACSSNHSPTTIMAATPPSTQQPGRSGMAPPKRSHLGLVHPMAAVSSAAANMPVAFSVRMQFGGDHLPPSPPSKAMSTVAERRQEGE